ncbi:MAG: SDR family oxidoreductase [Cytophagales bacterium]|nr:MAG: SDR family oxidoreductase [Cytophagales bacterium]TAG56148.1 MAG: SDR family oxidoreductase [Cytophagales bacterium]
MYALITGSSKGIGKDMAFELAQKGFNLLLIARNFDELQASKTEIQQKYKVEIDVLAIDLSDLTAPKKVLAWVESKNYQVSVLINNAGYGLWGMFEKLTFEQQQNMMILNMNTLVELTYLFLPILKKQSKSYILNVASTAAYQSVPGLGVYAATKAFVVSFSRALTFELKKTNVSVTCLSPGTTTTNFTNRAGIKASETLQATADKFTMPSDVVAKFGIDKMFAKKTEVIPGLTNIVTVWATYFLPKSIIESIAANLYIKNLKN